jgi:hypothetical protein
MADGIIFKLPRDGSPDFVKGSLSFKVEEAIAWLQANSENGWCNVNLKVSKSGKPYAALDTWKPNLEINNGGNNSYNPPGNNNQGNNQGFKSQGFQGGNDNKPSYENYPSGNQGGAGNIDDDIPF